ncbi:MAG: dipeptidase [Planctomycetota bacterium]|nr:dipeptidase [Planctomycetota bacterium]
MQQIDQYLSDNSARFESELLEFLRIPSVSADSAFKGDVRRAAEFVRSQFRSIDFAVVLVETAGHPIVYAESPYVPGAPTVLVYGHYDVQPPDPLGEWKTPPFEPAIRDGYVFARGATDDKGQVFTHIKSAEAWVKTVGSVPVNLKYVIEGEEEVGSNNLEIFLNASRAKLNSDVAVISDTSQFGPGRPAITHGLRGIVACEVTLRGPKQDLHSGIFGGSIANPVNALARIIASLHDVNGKILIPGFYDDIPPLTPEERSRLVDLRFDEAAYLREIEVSAPFGEPGYTTLERRWVRPTCDVNGITGGYQGEGPKTIVPAWARAKITCRLVPNQSPEKIVKSIEQHLRANCPPGVKLEFREWHGCPGYAFDTNNRYMHAATRAIADSFGVEPVFIREGGTIPVVESFRRILGLDTLLLGWGQNTDNLHGPNEHFLLADFHRGTKASAHLWQELTRS